MVIVAELGEAVGVLAVVAVAVMLLPRRRVLLGAAHPHGSLSPPNQSMDRPRLSLEKEEEPSPRRDEKREGGESSKAKIRYKIGRAHV